MKSKIERNLIIAFLTCIALAFACIVVPLALADTAKEAVVKCFKHRKARIDRIV